MTFNDTGKPLPELGGMSADQYAQAQEKAQAETLKPRDIFERRDDVQPLKAAATAMLSFKFTRAYKTLNIMLSNDRKRVTPRHRAVMDWIAYFINRGQTGYAWPGYRLLAVLTGMQVKSVRDACHQLASWGYLVRTSARLFNPDGRVGPAFTLAPGLGTDADDEHALPTTWAEAEAALDQQVKDAKRKLTAERRARLAAKNGGDDGVTPDAIDDEDDGVSPNAIDDETPETMASALTPSIETMASHPTPSMANDGVSPNAVHNNQGNRNQGKEEEPGERASSTIDLEAGNSCRNENGPQAKSATPAESTPAAAVSPSRQVAPVRAPSDPTPLPPAPATGTALAQFGGGREFKLGEPAGYDDIQVTPDNARAAIAACKVDLGGLPADVAEALIDETVAVLEKCARQWLGLMEDAANGDKAAAKKLKDHRTPRGWWKSSWQPNHAKTLRQRVPELIKQMAEARDQRLALPGPNGEKMLFGERDKIQGPPHVAALDGETGNLILKAARKWTKRTPVTCEDVRKIAPTLTEADRAHGDWIKTAGLLAFQQAAIREVEAWEVPDDLWAELFEMAPDVDEDDIERLVGAAFRDPSKVGLLWLRDAERTPEAVAEALRAAVQKIATARSKHDADWIFGTYLSDPDGEHSLWHALKATEAFADDWSVGQASKRIVTKVGRMGLALASEIEAEIKIEAQREIDRTLKARAEIFPEDDPTHKPLQWTLPEPPRFSAASVTVGKPEWSLRASQHNTSRPTNC